MATAKKESRKERWSRQYKKSLKSHDTEEHIDLFFYRPIGFFVAKVSEVLSITPNFLTILSLILGIGAGVLLYFDTLWINLCGIALLICANVLDSADGQLARLTHQYSRIGRILDGVAGDFWFVSIYTAICLREVHTSAFFMHHHWCIWIMGIVAGLCHIKQAQTADLYRQFHLFSLSDGAMTELEDVDELKHKYRMLTWQGQFWQKLFMKAYLIYTLQQAAFTPSMQQLRLTLQQMYPDGKPPVSFRRALRRQSLPLMKYTNALTFNWRSFILFISVLVGMPWIYFAVEIVGFSFLLMYMRYRHESICRSLNLQLKNGDFR